MSCVQIAMFKLFYVFNVKSTSSFLPFRGKTLIDGYVFGFKEKYKTKATLGLSEADL